MPRQSAQALQKDQNLQNDANYREEKTFLQKQEEHPKNVNYIIYKGRKLFISVISLTL